MRFIGMDVHRDACQVCILGPDGAERQERLASRVRRTGPLCRRP